jgi:hypothetical protein
MIIYDLMQGVDLINVALMLLGTVRNNLLPAEAKVKFNE